jgi:plasmid maintenance system antidote protein VapI
MKSFEVNFLLKKNGSSQADIAAQLQLSPHTISNVINGRSISMRVATKIASVIGKEVSEVFPQYSKAA